MDQEKSEFAYAELDGVSSCGLAQTNHFDLYLCGDQVTTQQTIR
jgi:hypothetical protein